jgi:exopolysaccharide biosynthesis protein
MGISRLDSLRRRAAGPVGAVLALTSTLTALSAAVPTAANASCGTIDKGILSRTPKVTALPKGARLRVWHDGRMTLSQVLVPASSSLGLHVWTSSALTRSKQPTKVLGSHSLGAAIMNGGTFNPGRGSLPDGIEVVSGVVAKAERTPHNAVLIGKSSHQLAQGSVALGGPIPHGSVAVVVSGGAVKAVRHSDLGRAPSAGQQVLTGTGDAATFLNRLHVGQKITVAYRGVYEFHYGEPTTFRVWDAIDHGMPYWLEGKQWSIPCTSRNLTHWSHSALGYTKTGAYFLLVVSGPDRSHYGGGASHQEMQYYLHRLGAYNADAFDGDTSSTLGVRHALGGTVSRVDKVTGFYQRAVPNYLAIK